MTLRVGIVSAGWGAFAHLPAWRAIPGVEVTAICTSREETACAAATRHGIARPFWNAEAMCADPDIDIVDLGTRPAVRLPMVLAALKHGKHVYNASPHAPNWEGAKAINEAWRGRASVGVVDAFSQYVPALQQMASMLGQGYLGEVLGGTAHFNISLFNTPDKRFPYNWFADGSAGVSAMRNNGSHMLYLLLHLFGPVSDVVADDRQVLREWTFPDGERVTPETTDYGNVILRFASGFSLALQASWSLPVHDGFVLDAYGSKGRLLATSPTFPTPRDCKLSAGQLGGALEPVELDPAFLKHPDLSLDWQAQVQPSYPMALSMQEMVAAINGAGKAAPDFARAFEVERIQEAIRRSSAGRCWITLAEID